MSYKTDIYKIQENGIDVFCFCEQSYLPKQSTEFKSYDGYLKIIRVLSGAAVWKIENKEYPVKKDDILIVNNTERRQIVMQNVNEPFVIEYAQFLHDGSELLFNEENQTVKINLPVTCIQKTIPVIEIFLK